MPDQTTPSWNSVNDALRLTHLLQPLWEETWARIPAWHPRNEVDPAAAAAAEAAAQQHQIDWESPDNPYLKRYKDTQSAYTESQQRLSALGSDPNAYIELGREKGWIEDDQPPEEFDDPRDRELAEFRAWREQVDAERAERAAAQGEELFHSDLDAWAKADDVTLTKADHNAILGVLLRSPDPTQQSYAREAYEAHVAHKKAEREQLEAEIREQLKRPRLPTPPVAGSPNTGVPNWGEMSEDEINQYMAQRAAGGA